MENNKFLPYVIYMNCVVTSTIKSQTLKQFVNYEKLVFSRKRVSAFSS